MTSRSNTTTTTTTTTASIDDDLASRAHVHAALLRCRLRLAMYKLGVNQIHIPILNLHQPPRRGGGKKKQTVEKEQDADLPSAVVMRLMATPLRGAYPDEQHITSSAIKAAPGTVGAARGLLSLGGSMDPLT